MAYPDGFEWQGRSNGEVVIHHHGRVATTLRGDRATDFLDDIADAADDDAQRAMARLTGNYKRGNERVARRHPRNQRHR